MKRWGLLIGPLILAILIIIGSSTVVKADASSFLSVEEMAYIKEINTVKVAAIDGAAPIMYQDANKEVQGISRLVMEEISKKTGLNFEYEIKGSLKEAFSSDCDVFISIPYPYAPDEMTLSEPYLKSETILYLNAAFDSEELQGKTYAAVTGSKIPAGIDEGNVVFYNSREESIDAVNRGEADYGYGNAYSLTFYMLHKSYKNIVTVPLEKESREYCVGFMNNNSTLISIINKSINEISEDKIQSLILNAMVYGEREVNLSMIMDSYGDIIIMIVLIVITVLVLGIASYVKMNKKLKVMNESLKMQNIRHERLSFISNEYLYEYFVNTKQVELSKKCNRLFGSAEALNYSVSLLKKMLSHINSDPQTTTISLRLADGSVGIFKAVNACVYDNQGELVSIVGKLIDISAQQQEKEKLIRKAQLDELTGLYNAGTVRALIVAAIKAKELKRLDAMLLIDCDNFKHINDTRGHLAGDQLLKHLGSCFKQTFRNTDIIGRIGGDEFIVYMKDISSSDFVYNKCTQLKKLYQRSDIGWSVSISIGAAILKEREVYEEVFKKADDKLYQAKRNGKNQVIVYDKSNE